MAKTSKAKPRKETGKSVKIVSDKKVKKAVTESGVERLVIVEENEFYTFTNLRPGPMFFKREDGKEDKFEGRETKDDFTPKERGMLLKSKDYENGWIIEEQDEAEVISNRNALSDKQLATVFKKYKKNVNGFKDFLEGVDSTFALNRIKDEILAQELPASLMAFCDYRLQVLEEEKKEEEKAPIARVPNDI